MSVADIPESEAVREEFFEGLSTDVEAEKTDPAEDAAAALTKPWDPDRIRVTTKQFSLRNILDLIDLEDLELAPDFQRNQVWKSWQKSRLIESVLLQIPLPAFYFAEDVDGMMRVVDGLQRLSTIHDFVRGSTDGRTLRSLEYLKQCEGLTFGELAPALQRRINNAQIVVHVIDPTTPRGVKYDIFKRINTGGTPLNSQEIRHCMSNSRSRDFLKRCTHAPEFDAATGGRFRDHIRMDDREVVLRYCAFRLGGVDGYVKDGSMDLFLEGANALLDDPEAVPDDELEDLYESFRSSMSKCRNLFGDHAFRKWPHGKSGRNPINRTLFESWSYVLDRYTVEDLTDRKDAIVAAARNLMTFDRTYLDAITTSTGDPRKVRLRFAAAGTAAEAGKA